MSSFRLTPEEEKLILKHRADKAAADAKKAAADRMYRIMNTKPASLSKEELVERAELSDANRIITEAKSRINYRNQSGDWVWDTSTDIGELQWVYDKLGKEMPKSDW